jgi:hypothetical protein
VADAGDRVSGPGGCGGPAIALRRGGRPGHPSGPGPSGPSSAGPTEMRTGDPTCGGEPAGARFGARRAGGSSKNVKHSAATSWPPAPCGDGTNLIPRRSEHGSATGTTRRSFDRPRAEPQQPPAPRPSRLRDTPPSCWPNVTPHRPFRHRWGVDPETSPWRRGQGTRPAPRPLRSWWCPVRSGLCVPRDETPD